MLKPQLCVALRLKVVKNLEFFLRFSKSVEIFLFIYEFFSSLRLKGNLKVSERCQEEKMEKNEKKVGKNSWSLYKNSMW